MRAFPLIEYAAADDEYIYRQAFTDLEPGFHMEVEALTWAGQRSPDSASKPNEDAFSVVSGDRLAALVLDGASSQMPIPELGDMSGARFASHQLKNFFERPWPPDANEYTILHTLNKYLGERLRKFASVSYDNLNTLPTSTATLLTIDPKADRLSVGHVGDTFAIALMDNGLTKLLTNNLHKVHDQAVLEHIRQIAIEDDITPREARKDPRIGADIKAMFQGTRNTPDGSGEGMMNGDPNMDQYIHTRSMSLKGVRAVLLGSDGLVPPGLDERLAADRKQVLEITRASGLRGLARYTAAVADADPDRWHLRYKHRDDMTGIWAQW